MTKKYFSLILGDLSLTETCEKDGTVYEDLDEVPSGDTCNECYCDLGEIICSADICEPEETKNCTYSGTKYEHLEIFLDACNTCACEDGEITCTEKSCDEIGKSMF